MLDPITALSVAGTIVQFVDFSYKIITFSTQLQKSARGALQVPEILELVANDLVKLTKKLHRLDDASESVSDEEQALIDLCKSCNSVADEIISKLRTLKMQGGPRDVLGKRTKKWESFHQAIRYAWADDQLSELSRTLSGLKQALGLRVMVDIRYFVEIHV